MTAVNLIQEAPTTLLDAHIVDQYEAAKAAVAEWWPAPYTPEMRRPRVVIIERPNRNWWRT